MSKKPTPAQEADRLFADLLDGVLPLLEREWSGQDVLKKIREARVSMVDELGPARWRPSKVKDKRENPFGPNMRCSIVPIPWVDDESEGE